MRYLISNLIYEFVEDHLFGNDHVAKEEVIKKFIKIPKIKPPRRKPSIKNKSHRTDYSKNYMHEYRQEGKDYQKKPDNAKELRKKQKESLKEKFGI